jgi:hypothetical protein
MAQQHVQILQALGMPDNQIQELENLKDVKDFKPEKYADTLTTIQRNKLLNDESFLNSIPEEKLPELRKAVESGQYQRFIKELEEVAASLGVKVDDLPEETRRSLKKLSLETNKRYLEKHGGDNKGAVTELQTKLQEALKNYDELSKGQQAKIDELLSKERGTISQKMETLVARSKVSAIKGLTVKPEYITQAATDKIKAIHDVVFNPDSMEFELKQKGKPQLDVLKANGSKLSFDEELTRVLTEDGLISTDVA